MSTVCRVCKTENTHKAQATLNAACRELVEWDDEGERIADDDGKPYGLHSTVIDPEFQRRYDAMLDATKKLDELTGERT